MNPKRVAYNKEMEEYNKKREEVKEVVKEEVKEVVKDEEVKNVVVEKKD
tara:strand:- start:625 stop:771 length:147 start_codon:yes stop_codon:yes gene_type:complete